MPFKASEARIAQNRVVYKYGGQQLHVKYNAGRKYAELEEKIDKEGLDRMGDQVSMTAAEIRDELEGIHGRIGRNGQISASEIRADIGSLLEDIGEPGKDVDIPQVRRRICDLLCMVIEEWDYLDEKGEPLEIDPEVLANEGHPLEFYSGLSSAISEDFANKGGGTKRGS